MKTCCQYPDLVFIREDMEICSNFCAKKANGTENLDFCCDITCAFEKLGLLVGGELHQQGMISTFASAVDFSTPWMAVIESAVNFCYEKSEFLILKSIELSVIIF